MTLSKEARRSVLPGLVLSTWMAGPLAAAPGFMPVRPGIGIAPRPAVTARATPVVRGDSDLRHMRRGGGRFAGGVGVAVLPIVAPPVETAAANAVAQNDGPVERDDERWVWDGPQRASCIRPLIINLRVASRAPQPGPRVIYGTALPLCPRS